MSVIFFKSKIFVFIALIFLLND